MSTWVADRDAGVAVAAPRDGATAAEALVVGLAGNRPVVATGTVVPFDSAAGADGFCLVFELQAAANASAPISTTIPPRSLTNPLLSKDIPPP
jgi:hypothetical protein